MFDHHLRVTIVRALAADPLVDDDEIAVECFRGARHRADAADVEDEIRISGGGSP